MALNFMDQQYDPLGLRWLPMLTLYSNIGKKSNSDEKKCELGEELKQLDGRHEVVINGINAKLDSLIQAGGLALPDEDMVDLKQKIVDKLGEVASSTGTGTQSSAPVSCTCDGIVFDEASKQVLIDVVSGEIKSHREQNPVTLDTGALSALLDEKIANQLVSFDEIKQTQNAMRTEVRSTLRVIQDRLSNLTVGEEGGTGETRRDQNLVPDEEIEIPLPDGYDEEFYQNDIEAVIEMFRNKDERLFILGDDYGKKAETFSSYRRTFGISETIQREQLSTLLKERVAMQNKSNRLILYTDPMVESIWKLFDQCLFYVPSICLPSDILRILHTSLVKHENSSNN